MAWHSRHRKRMCKPRSKTSARFLSNETYIQLRLIEAFYELHVTPALLRRCCLVSNTAKDEMAAIYYKYVIGNSQMLDKIAALKRPQSGMYGTEGQDSCQILTFQPTSTIFMAITNSS